MTPAYSHEKMTQINIVLTDLIQHLKKSFSSSEKTPLLLFTRVMERFDVVQNPTLKGWALRPDSK
jgi:hypothetical protein